MLTSGVVIVIATMVETVYCFLLEKKQGTMEVVGRMLGRLVTTRGRAE